MISNGTVTGNPNKDFKEQNPHVCTVPDFAKVYENEKPADASKIIWSIYYISVLSDSKNPYRNFKTEQERIDAVMENYYPHLDLSKWGYLLKTFQMFVMEKEETLFNIQTRKLEEITAKFDTMNMDTDDELDRYLKIAKTLPSIWKSYEDIKAKFMESIKHKTQNFGNTELSKSEARRNKKD